MTTPRLLAGYKCADTLDAPHQRFFEALDVLLRISGRSPVQFDALLKQYSITNACHSASDACRDTLSDQILSDYHPVAHKQRMLDEVKMAKTPKEQAARFRALKEANPIPAVIATKQFDLPEDEVLTALTKDYISLIKKCSVELTKHVMQNGLEGITQVYQSQGDPQTVKLFQHMQASIYERSLFLMAHAPGTPLFQQFAEGKRHLCDLSKDPLHVNWKNYRLEFASQRDYLLTAIVVALGLTPEQRRSAVVKNALDELRNAYADALLTPEQREAAQRQHEEAQATRQQQEAEKAHQAEMLKQETALRLQQQEEQALLRVSPYSSPALQSLETRATRNTGRIKELAPVWEEIVPVLASLNNILPAHRQLAESLFKDKNTPTLAILEHIATGSYYQPAPVPDEARNATREHLLSIIAKPLDELLPNSTDAQHRAKMHALNSPRHEGLVNALLASPYLLIAAIGTEADIKDARAIQQLLFPSKKADEPDTATAEFLRQELRALAGKTLKNSLSSAGLTAPETVLKKAETMQLVTAEPTPPPKAPPREITPKNWEEIKSRTDSFVREHMAEKPPFTMFRCNLGMQPGHAITFHLSRWVMDGNKRNVETRSDTILLGEPSLQRALEIKKRLQSHVFNAHSGVVEHRRLHEGHYVLDDGLFIPQSAPMPDRANPAEDGKAGHIMKRSGVYVLRLQFPHPDPQTNEPTYTEMEISLGLRQTADIAEANRRRLSVLDYIATNLEFGKHVTMQDVRSQLQNTIITESGPDAWQQAQTIDLRQQPQISRTHAIDFPGEGEQGQTTIHFQNPTLEGSPIAFWTIPFSLRLNGREFANPSINTHVQDANLALSRIDEIASHLKSRLEAYGKAHPEARWQMGQNGRLGQLDVEQIQQTQNMDWTRFDRITNELGYINQLAVRASEPNAIENGRVSFTLGIQRADGSDFLETQLRSAHHAIPLKRTITLPIAESASEQDISDAIEQVRARMQASFKHVMDEAYQTTRDERFEPAPGVAPKAAEPYNAHAIAAKFKAVLKDTAQAMRSEGIDVQGEGTQPEMVAASAASRVTPRVHISR